MHHRAVAPHTPDIMNALSPKVLLSGPSLRWNNSENMASYI